MWDSTLWGKHRWVMQRHHVSTFSVALAVFDRFEGGWVLGSSQGCMVRTMCSSVHCSSRRACSSRVNWPCLVRMSSLTWAHDDRAEAEVRASFQEQNLIELWAHFPSSHEPWRQGSGTFLTHLKMYFSESHVIYFKTEAMDKNSKFFCPFVLYFFFF